MNELRRLEEDEKIIIETQKIRNFQKEIKLTFDKNRNKSLDNCLQEFLNKHDLEESDITHNLRMFVEYIKEHQQQNNNNK